MMNYSIEGALAKTRVSALMSSPASMVRAGETCGNALELMIRKNVGSVAVVAPEAFEGICLKKHVIGLAPVFFVMRHFFEILKKGSSEQAIVDTVTVRERFFAYANQVIPEVLGKITDNMSWRLIVLNDEDHVVGVLSATDIFKFISRNLINEKKTMNIGQDATFHNLTFTWSGSDLVVTRGEESVTTARKVTALSTWQHYEKKSRQHIMLLRLICAEGQRLLFLDADPVQTNAREVESSLEDLQAVYDWMLMPGYAYRQGDVGIYRVEAIPSKAREISTEVYAETFEKVLSRRHMFEPASSCRFFHYNDRCFIKTNNGVNLMHPEHEPQFIDSGTYELIEAKGVALPNIVGLRNGEVLMRA